MVPTEKSVNAPKGQDENLETTMTDMNLGSLATNAAMGHREPKPMLSRLMDGVSVPDMSADRDAKDTIRFLVFSVILPKPKFISFDR